MNSKPLAIGDKIECRSGDFDEKTFTPWITGIVTGLDGNDGFFVKVNLLESITGIIRSAPTQHPIPIWRAWSTENKYWRRIPDENGKTHE